MSLAPHPVNGLAEVVIGAAIDVHAALGPGLLESTYQRCIRRELQLRDITYAAEVELPITYRGETLDCGYRIDLRVDHRLIVEIKSVEKLMPIHEAQLLTYLRPSFRGPPDQLQRPKPSTRPPSSEPAAVLRILPPPCEPDSRVVPRMSCA